MSYGRTRNAVPVTIASGQEFSTAAGAGGTRLVGIIMPAAWTAADLSLQAAIGQSATNPPVITWGEVVDEAGTPLVLAAGPGASEYVALADTEALLGLGQIRIRSGTAAVPVNQAADRVVTLIFVGD